MPSANGVARFNDLPAEPILQQLLTCMNAPGWATAVLAGRPYPDAESLLATAYRFALVLSADDLGLALSRHPRIGERPGGPGPEAEHSRAEQSGVGQADTDALHAGNLAYEKKFDRVFLIRAAGRSGPEILEALNQRLDNEPAVEEEVVRDQLAQIAQLRLGSLLEALALGKVS